MIIPVQRPFLGPEEVQAVQRVFEGRWLGLGAFTQEFERVLREFLGVRHVIAVSSGTAALHLALDILDLQPGDEVLDGRRDALMDHLKHNGIMTGVHYIPNHLHRAFVEHRTSLPTAERLGREILTLPLFYEMTDEQVDRVIAAVRRFFSPAAAVVTAPSVARPAAVAKHPLQLTSEGQ